MNIINLTKKNILLHSQREVVEAELKKDIFVKKILLIQPPDTDSKSFNYAAGKRGRLYNYPPYGLGILAAQLRKLNIEVDILNLNFEILKACNESISKEAFDFDNI